MQTNNNDHSKHLKDEDGVNFRPSPNFKHMKKYLKSKFEESGGASSTSVTGESSGSADSAVEQTEQGRCAGAVQPPLPPHPPPPDSPPRAELKMEREDDGYEPAEPRPEPVDRIMCRQFARGSCTRGDACIYAHEIILDQLHGVYTFCKNFQNAAGCNLPKCKFVHASIFEKEFFYRTGYMPAHALAHIKEATQPSHHDGGQAPAEPMGGMAAVGAPALGVAAVAVAAEAGGPGVAMALPERDIHELAPRDAVPADNLPKKCKNCDINEFRLQVLKQKVETVLRSNEEISKKTALLNMKTSKLNAVIAALMKTSPPTAPQPSGSGMNAPAGPSTAPTTPIINVRNEKEINGLVDQLKLRYPPAPHLHPPHNDENKGRVPPALMRLLLKGLPPEHPPPDPRQ